MVTVFLVRLILTYTTRYEWSHDFIREKLNDCQKKYVSIRPYTMDARTGQVKVWTIVYPQPRYCKVLERKRREKKNEVKISRGYKTS